jgi:hypothetical protein
MCKRQRNRLSGFRLYYFYLATLPVNVRKLHPRNVDSAKPRHRRKQDHSIVAFAHARGAVNYFQHRLNL